MNARLIVLLMAALLAGCSREPGPPMSEAKFVAVMVELRKASGQGVEGAAFAAKREEILKRQGVTEAQLKAYTTWGARDPERLREAFDRIAAALEPQAEE